MSISSTSAKDLAALGIRLEITAGAGFSSTAVMEIIRTSIANGGHVTVHAAKYSATSLKAMVKLGADSVSIVI